MMKYARTAAIWPCWRPKDFESRGRLENVKELRSSIVGYIDNHPE